MALRNRFDEQLTNLNNSLIEMGSIADRQIRLATKAFETHDLKLAQEVIGQSGLIETMEKDIDHECLKLIMTQNPVARDLRLISTVIKMIADLKRINDHACVICELCEYLPFSSSADDIIFSINIAGMAKIAMKMVTDSIDAFVRKDLDMAGEIIARDDEVDDLFVLAKQKLIDVIHADANMGELALDLLQIAKYYERIGDHAVNLAEWVIYSITGRHKSE
ncbi:MAG: phosphate signaling complex protein PhoU [Eubacteriaceae bacterium]|nr:phosphate signaling complex protein PhoU [Eubacteriaceae bacterium]